MDRNITKKLGNEFKIIEEGRCGRTSTLDDPEDANLNGLTALPDIINSNLPIDLLVLMLGTNNLKSYFNVSAEQIANGAGKLITTALSLGLFPNKILLICPPPIIETANQEINKLFSNGISKSQDLAVAYYNQSTKFGCHYFDASKSINSSSIDGIHLDQYNHSILAKALSLKIIDIFPFE